jgi:hypothetical protein
VKRRRYMERRVTAYHEAAHAVMREWLDAGLVLSVTIVPTDGEQWKRTEGATSFCLPVPQPGPYEAPAEIAIAYAGPLASERVRGRRLRGGQDGDVSWVRSIIEDAGLEGGGPPAREWYSARPRLQGEARAMALAARGMARALLAQPDLWRAVKLVAGELLARQTVHGSEVHKIVRAAKRRPRVIPVFTSAETHRNRQDKLPGRASGGARVSLYGSSSRGR